jgi:hypothetical protein
VKAETKLNITKLKGLLEKATRGPWRLDTGLVGDSLNITALERGGFSGRRDGDGPICHVSTERLHFSRDEDRFGNARGKPETWRTPIHKARADAELIVEAVNALPELMRRLKLDADETAWLIEWPADKYGPVRYWAAGEPQAVIDATNATRFCREADAMAVMRAEGLKGCEPAEHMWCAPKKREKAAA